MTRAGCLVAIALLATSRGGDTTRHEWGCILCPDVAAPWEREDEVSFVVDSERDNLPSRERRLSFAVLKWGLCADPLAKRLPKPKRLRVRLHLPDGSIVSPVPEPTRAKARGWDCVRVSRHSTWSLSYEFPWQAEPLPGGWVEFDAPGGTYWVEVPYGFLADPTQPIRPAAAAADKPRLAPAMANLGRRERIVPWLWVEYDLGVTEEKWPIPLRHANPFEASCEVELYKGGDCSPAYRWRFISPRCRSQCSSPSCTTAAGSVPADAFLTTGFSTTSCSVVTWGTAGRGTRHLSEWTETSSVEPSRPAFSSTSMGWRSTGTPGGFRGA